MNFPIAIEEHYRLQRANDFDENMLEIYNCLAADAFDKVSNSPADNPDIIENLKKADKINALHEYTWLIKGFNEIRQGFNMHSPIYAYSI
jgi:hypothetical protein